MPQRAGGGSPMTPEIRAFEYALGLFAVLIGLAVADIATSLHRLLRTPARVNWDPLTLLAAFYAFCVAVGMWFDLWGVRGFVETRHFFFYFSFVAELVVLFLIAAASLPDEAGDGDLRAFYARNRRYFWLLMAVFQLSYLLNGLWFMRSMLGAGAAGRVAYVIFHISFPCAVAVLLACVRSRAAHYLGLIVLLAFTAWHYAPYQIN
jgi:hypothetical protein